MLHEALCGLLSKLRATVSYMKLYVDKNLNCGQQYVT